MNSYFKLYKSDVRISLSYDQKIKIAQNLKNIFHNIFDMVIYPPDLIKSLKESLSELLNIVSTLFSCKIYNSDFELSENALDDVVSTYKVIIDKTDLVHNDTKINYDEESLKDKNIKTGFFQIFDGVISCMIRSNDNLEHTKDILTGLLRVISNFFSESHVVNM